MRGTFLAAVMIGLAACVASGKPVVGRPVDLVLQLSDLPQGFSEQDGHPRPTPPAVALGYERRYYRPAFFGPSSVTTVADVFANEGEAIAQTQFYLAYYVGLGEKKVAEDLVGDSSTIYQAVSNLDASEFTVVFRFRNVLNVVTVLGARGQVDQETAIQLARKQLARQDVH